MLLKYGSRGSLVKYVQESLNKLGFNCGKADGIFGNLTRVSVILLQKKYNLIPDAIVGSKTLSLIRDLVDANYYIQSINPLNLRNEIVKKVGSKITGDFCNSGFFGYTNGKQVSVSVLVQDGKFLANRLPHDNVARGTFIIYKDGSMEIARIKDIDRERTIGKIKFAISGCILLPSLDFKAEWFNENEIGYKTWRTLLAINEKTNKVDVIVIKDMTAREDQQLLKKLGYTKVLMLDGGLSCNARFNGKTIRTTSRVIYSILRW